jgi:esterase
VGRAAGGPAQPRRLAGLPPPHTVAAAAADVDRLVEHLDFHAAAVLGHSFGGKVALTYAAHHGDELGRCG